MKGIKEIFNWELTSFQVKKLFLYPHPKISIIFIGRKGKSTGW